MYYAKKLHSLSDLRLLSVSNLIGMGSSAFILSRLPKEIILNKKIKDQEADITLNKVVLLW